jgi:NAD(P)-dependent dehydrogenase (short-subunit alcohol dehydrogenase family)
MLTFKELETFDLSKRTALITGSNSGLGYETARFLAKRGAHVILCSRSAEKGQAALDRILAETPTALLSLELLDLADSTSIDALSKRLHQHTVPIDFLINNAGIMAVPYALTQDGFESQIGVNHLGHFRLSALLMDRLSDNARIVNVSSNAHRQGRLDFDNFLYAKGGYTPFGAYARSKLCNLLFTQSLGKAMDRSGRHITVVAAHPGVARTGLFDRKNDSRFVQALIKTFMGLVPSAEAGARPLIMAALDPNAQHGDYYGPGKRGEVKLERPIAVVFDSTIQHQLWTLSQDLTGVSFPHVTL